MGDRASLTEDQIKNFWKAVHRPPHLRMLLVLGVLQAFWLRKLSLCCHGWVGLRMIIFITVKMNCFRSRIGRLCIGPQDIELLPYTSRWQCCLVLADEPKCMTSLSAFWLFMPWHCLQLQFSIKQIRRNLYQKFAIMCCHQPAHESNIAECTMKWLFTQFRIVQALWKTIPSPNLIMQLIYKKKTRLKKLYIYSIIWFFVRSYFQKI